MLQLEVNMVCLDENDQYVVILTNLEEKIALPIWIGSCEAQSIAMTIQDEDSPRPFAHDLFIALADETDCFIEKVVISNISGDNTYFAEIHLNHDDEETLILDARPSDAIALALKSGAEIFMATRLVEFTHDLEDLFPEDFQEQR